MNFFKSIPNLFLCSRSTEQGFYQTDNKNIPVKWCAPEVLQSGSYTSKSDVWAFGIVLWELFSFGAIPYTGMTNAEAAERVIAGYQLHCPDGCPPEVYALMNACWLHRHEARPSFKEIFDQLADILTSYKRTNIASPLSNSITSSLFSASISTKKPVSATVSEFNIESSLGEMFKGSSMYNMQPSTNNYSTQASANYQN